MTIRNLVFLSVLSISMPALAEEAAKEAAAEPAPAAETAPVEAPAPAPLSYCQKLGKTAGFEGGDYSDFVSECEEKRAENTKAAAE